MQKRGTAKLQSALVVPLNESRQRRFVPRAKSFDYTVE